MFKVRHETTGKNTELSITYQNCGNAMYKQGKFFIALELYNKSLMFAEPNSAEVPLAYANRSAVYLKVKEFQLCLDNIQLAIDSGYSVGKMQTLKDREEKCKKLMKNEVKSDDDDPWKFFKLSYPANEKIPFIAGCLELREDEKFGRHIVTNRDLKPGDIIGIEEPLFKMLLDTKEYLRCTNCLKSNKMSLIPSDIICGTMYCTKECSKEAEDVFLKAKDQTLFKKDFIHRMLFKSLAICDGSFEKLQQLVNDSELSNKTIFDFDYSSPEDQLFNFHQLVAFNGLQIIQPTAKMFNDLHRFNLLATKLFQDSKEREIASGFMIRSYKTLQINGYAVQVTDALKDLAAPETIGQGLFLFGSLLSHSCIANIDRVVVDNKFVFIVQPPIAKDEQLFINYGPKFTFNKLEARQKKLKDVYGFNCSCEACVRRYPTFDFPWEVLAHSVIGLSIVDMKKEFKKNCKIIAKNPDKTATLMIAKLVFKNKCLLMMIAKVEPYIFYK